MLPPNSSPLSQDRKYAMRLHTAFRCGLPKRCVFLGWHVLTERLCRDRLAAIRKCEPDAAIQRQRRSVPAARHLPTA